jgi:hypothetical protein
VCVQPQLSLMQVCVCVCVCILSSRSSPPRHSPRRLTGSHEDPGMSHTHTHTHPLTLTHTHTHTHTHFLSLSLTHTHTQYPGVAESIDSDIANLEMVLAMTGLVPHGLFVQNLLNVARTELAWECDYVSDHVRLHINVYTPARSNMLTLFCSHLHILHTSHVSLTHHTYSH